MKQLKNVLILLFFTSLCFGQKKNFYVPIYGDGDTTLWFKWQQENFEKAELLDLTKTTDLLHFRFSSEIQAVDIWTSDFITFSGTITNFTTGRTKKKQKQKREFFSDSKSIDTTTAKHVYKIFIDNDIFEIPPQDSIENWGNGQDGITYFIELATNGNYSFKDYWTPSQYKNEIKEAANLNQLTENLEELLNLEKSFGEFINSLPYGTYNAGGMAIVTSKRKKRRPNR